MDIDHSRSLGFKSRRERLVEESEDIRVAAEPEVIFGWQKEGGVGSGVVDLSNEEGG